MCDRCRACVNVHAHVTPCLVITEPGSNPRQTHQEATLYIHATIAVLAIATNWHNVLYWYRSDHYQFAVAAGAAGIRWLLRLLVQCRTCRHTAAYNSHAAGSSCLPAQAWFVPGHGATHVTVCPTHLPTAAALQMLSRSIDTPCSTCMRSTAEHCSACQPRLVHAATLCASSLREHACTSEALFKPLHRLKNLCDLNACSERASGRCSITAQAVNSGRP